MKSISWTSNAIMVAIISFFVGYLIPYEAKADVLYSDSVNFLNDTGGSLYFESFESLSVDSGPIFPNAGHSDIVTTYFTIHDDSTQLGVFDRSSTYVTSGQHDIDGDQFVAWEADTVSNNVRFDFNMPIAAFGVSLTDVLDAAITSDRTMSLITNGGANFLVLTGHPPNGLPSANKEFVGIIADTQFTTLTLSIEGTAGGLDGIGIDAVHFGTVPIPSAVWLLGAAFIGFLGFRGKYARKQR